MGKPIHDRLRAWFDAGLAAVEPNTVTRNALNAIDIGVGKVIVLAIGKASVAMAAAANDVLGDRLTSGVIVAKQGQLDQDVQGFRAIEAAHPVPDESSLQAGEAVLELVYGMTADDTVIALISGGGSALVEYPTDGISLMDMQITTELLMYAGAGIYDLNTVRKALSAIKGGGLRREIADARCITLMLSDVIGNDHSVIASGPTVPEPLNHRAAWQVIEDFKIQDQVPESVARMLQSDSPPRAEIDTSRDVRQIIADNSTFIAAVESAAEKDALHVEQTVHEWRDDARDLASRLLDDGRRADADVAVIIGGGEATSIVRGNGRGGRNTETALQAAMLMTSSDDWTIASLASDGDDGNSGAAGAIVDASTVDDALAARDSLAVSDSAGFLEERGGLVVSGHTGTNVNDVYIAVRNSALSGVLK